MSNLPARGSQPHPVRLLVILFLTTALGTILGCALFFVIMSDAFSHWEKTAQAPSNSAEIVAGGLYQVYIETSQGETLSCKPGGDCRIPDTVSSSEDTYSSCDPQDSAFKFPSRPPENIVSCLSVSGGFAEVGYRIIYALDDQGGVWKWESSHTSYEILLAPLLFVAGGGIGLALGSIGWVVVRLVRKTNGSRRIPGMECLLLALPWLVLVLAAVGYFLWSLLAAN